MDGSIEFKTKFQTACEVEGELEYKCQSDHRSKCYSDKKYLSKESEKEIRNEEKKKEKRRDRV